MTEIPFGEWLDAFDEWIDAIPEDASDEEFSSESAFRAGWECGYAYAEGARQAEEEM